LNGGRQTVTKRPRTAIGRAGGYRPPCLERGGCRPLRLPVNPPLYLSCRLIIVESYCPISNLSIFSKLLERLVFLSSSKLQPRLQSAYRGHYSTETAVLKALFDILYAVDSGNLALLKSLNLSFNTVDHVMLLRRLEVSYGIGGFVHNWFASYLGGRWQCVRCGEAE